MTKLEARKAMQDQTWLVWSRTDDDSLVQITGSFDGVWYGVRVKDSSMVATRDRLRIATAKDMIELADD